MPNLNFVGKSKVVNYHRQVSFRFLERQYGSSENMIIHGDNLLALRSLLATHRGKIKCIYIDPPYNTGNENWIYNDNVNDPEIKTWIGKVVGDEETDLNRHDKWLCMMYPRLRLLHELLSDDGAIFISIDDNEVANLKLICHEIFGSNNFLAQCPVKRIGGRQDSKFYAIVHEYLICYAKNSKMFIAGREKKIGDSYPKFDPIRNRNYKLQLLRKWGSNSRREDRPNLFYPIIAPDGSEVFPMLPNGEEGRWRWSKETMEKYLGCWRWGKDTMQQAINDGRVEFIRKGDEWIPYEKIFEPDEDSTKPFSTWIDDVGSGAAAIKKIFEKNVFDYAKSTELIRRVLQMSGIKDGIILDAFAGSGTTAQSVIELNREDQGSRKFILIESMDYCESITAERVRRVGEDFSFYELGDPIFVDGELNPDLSRNLFRRYLYFSETKREIPPMNPDESTLLGINDGIAYHLIDGDLNFNSLAQIKTRSESYIIHAESCTISQETRDQFKIIFRKIPRDIRRI